MSIYVHKILFLSCFAEKLHSELKSSVTSTETELFWYGSLLVINVGDGTIRLPSDG